MSSNFIQDSLNWVLMGGSTIYSQIIFSLVFTSLLIFLTLGKKISVTSFIVFCIFFYIIYYLISTLGSSGLNISTPPTLRNGPTPHLGRDGVSLVNYYPNTIGYPSS